MSVLMPTPRTSGVWRTGTQLWRKVWERNWTRAESGSCRPTRSKPWALRSALQAQLYMEGLRQNHQFPVSGEFRQKSVIRRWTDTLSAGKIHERTAQGGRTGHPRRADQGSAPNLTITIPEINETTLGEIFYFFELAVSYMGDLLRINAFDQPASNWPRSIPMR